MITTLQCVLVDGSVGDFAPTVQPLAFEQGEAVTINFVVVNSAGAAVDLTGYSLVFTAKFDLTSTDATLSKQATIDNAPAGLAHSTLVGTDTRTLSPAAYKFDVVLVDGAGNAQHVVPVSTLNLLRSVY